MIRHLPRATILLLIPILLILAPSSHLEARSLAGPRAPGAKATIVPTPVVTGGSVAAIVNGHPIPMSTYRAVLIFLKRQSQHTSGLSLQTLAQQAMNNVIVDEVVREYAVMHHLTVSNAAIDAQIARDQAALHGARPFQRNLAQLGVSFSFYRELVRTALLGQLVSHRVVPLDTKLHSWAQARHILVSFHPTSKRTRSDARARSRAQQILRQLQHGASFAALARLDSDDPGSKSAGGDLGRIYAHQTVPAFDHALFTLPLQRPAVIRTVYGYHVVEVLSRGTARLPLTLQQEEQRQAFGKWLDQQMRHASIRRLAQVIR